MMQDDKDGLRREVCRSLAVAAIARQKAYNESSDTYKAASKNLDLSTEARSEAFILGAIFLSMAKAARMEAEAMVARSDCGNG